MKRIIVTMLMLAAVVAFTAPAMAGGSAPGLPTGGVIAKSPKVDAVFVIDPHTITSTAGKGSIWLRSPQNPQGHQARAEFQMPFTMAFALGCDLTLTNTRFLNRQLEDWIDHFTLVQLFSTLGITIATDAPFAVPVVTQIVSAKCVPVSAADPDFTAGQPFPGYLVVEAIVQLAVSP